MKVTRCLQTGETYKGQPLIDRQHAHDLFMELSATYTVPIAENATWFAYQIICSSMVSGSCLLRLMLRA
jgi:hypothetical protein